jgi:hypothetical protein
MFFALVVHAQNQMYLFCLIRMAPFAHLLKSVNSELCIHVKISTKAGNQLGISTYN